VLLRDDKSFPYIIITSDHWAPQILKHRGARSRRGSYYGPFASVWAVNRTITALQRAFLAALLLGRIFRKPHAAVPAASDQALLGALHPGDRFCRIRRAGAGGQRIPVRQEPGGARRAFGEMEKASTALDFERAAIYRDRLAALSATQSTQGINPRSTEEADVFAIHQEGGFSGIEVFFFRTGQNWGNRAYFPKADRSLGPGEVLGAFLAQFYDDKPCPSLILLSHDIPECHLLAEALSVKTGRKVESRCRSAARRPSWWRTRWSTRARRWGEACRHLVAAEAAQGAGPTRSGLPRVPRRIEVYDNSHIQGSNAVGAMIVAGEAGFRRTSIASSTSAPANSRPATTSA
jgi:excinuclease ABC subunit C